MNKPYHLLTPAERLRWRISQNQAIDVKASVCDAELESLPKHNCLVKGHDHQLNPIQRLTNHTGQTLVVYECPKGNHRFQALMGLAPTRILMMVKPRFGWSS